MIAIYARQSIDKKDSISIETQINICRAEINSESEYKVYQDKGFSGKNIDRPAFTQLMKDVKNGLITKIVVYRLDRISRSITDFANIIDVLEEKHVDFVSANEKFDTSTPVGRAMLYIVMVFAQLERETIAERIRDNYYSRGKTGVWLGGPAPIGFDNEKVTVNEKKVSTIKPNGDLDVVIKIFNTYANSPVSLGELARSLLNEYGGMWNNIKLSRILHNPAYVQADADVYMYYKTKKCIIVNPPEEFTGEKGCNLYGKRDRGSNKYRLTENHVLSLAMHDGVVDSQTWLKCQYKLDANKQIKNTGKGKHSWLTGLVKCGYCGYSMNVKVTKNGCKYFNCTGKYTTDLCIEKLSTHRMEDIEDYVYEEMLKISEKLNGMEFQQEQPALSREQNELKLELLDVENQIESLVNSLSEANSILISYVNKKIIALDDRKNEILNALSALDIKKKDRVAIPDLSEWENMDISSRHNVAAALIEKVKVFNDSITIDWKY